MKVFSVAAVFFLAVGTGLFFAFGLRGYFSLEFIQAAGDPVRAWIQARPLAGALAFFALYAALILLCVPVAAIMTLTAGFLFGFRIGVLLVIPASVTGAVLLFLLASSSLGGILRRRTEKFYTRYAVPMQEDAFHYMIFSRLVPGLPSAVATILPALFDVPLRIFVSATFLGILPSTLVLVYLGQALGTAESVSDLVTPQVLGAFALLALLALGPIIWRKIKTGSTLQ